MTDFDSLSPEERAEWRSDPVTEAFLRTLVDDRRTAMERLAELVKGEAGVSRPRLEHVGGQLYIVDDILQRATR